jgi:hypothetical protein
MTLFSVVEGVLSPVKTNGVIARLDRTDPGWRFSEIEAERGVIPDAVNSASIVMAAKAGIPKDWLATRVQPIDRHRPLGPDDLPRLAEVLSARAPSVRLTSEQAVELRQELERLAPALEEARELANRPNGRHRVSWARHPLKTLLGHVPAVQEVAQLQVFDAVVRAEDGDIDGALQSCRASLNAGRSICDEPLAISQVTRIRVDDLVARAVERVLAQGEASDPALAELQGLLEDEAAQPLLRIALRGERGYLNDLFDRLSTGELRSLSGDRYDDIAALEGWLYQRSRFKRCQGVFLDEMTELLKVADRPSHEQLAAYGSWQQRNKDRRSETYTYAAYAMLPSLEILLPNYLAARARLSNAIVAVAAERFRPAHGRWPTSVEEISALDLSHPPRDIFVAAPIRYQTTKEGVKIYSVGQDAKDNHGMPGPEEFEPLVISRNNPSRVIDAANSDIVFRLWNLAQRSVEHDPSIESSRPDGVP